MDSKIDGNRTKFKSPKNWNYKHTQHRKHNNENLLMDSLFGKKGDHKKCLLWNLFTEKIWFNGYPLFKKKRPKNQVISMHFLV